MRLALALLLAVLGAACQHQPLLVQVPPDLGPPPSPPPPSGSLWRPDLGLNYDVLDVRARFPGDVLTIVINEQSKGKKDASTEGSSDSSIAASVQDFFGIPLSAVKFLSSNFDPQAIITAETKRTHKADGETSREGTLAASITVTVIGVDVAGNLQVQGDKIVTVNDEDQHIVLTGKVRPVDVGPDNSVLSSRLADARISYFGYGTVGDKENVPVLQRLMDWVWPF